MVTETKTNAVAYERLLIEHARRGDRSALRKLVDQHKHRLFAFIWRMIRDHHEAEDLCQDTFLKAFASLDTFSTRYRFSTWLFTIGYRVCLNRMRRKRPVTGDVDFTLIPQPLGDSPQDVLESEEASRLRAGVWSAVERLTPPQRAAILLFYRHEMSCQEVSAVMELPLATVKSHLHRARARLREILESASEEDLAVFRNHSSMAV